MRSNSWWNWTMDFFAKCCSPAFFLLGAQSFVKLTRGVFEIPLFWGWRRTWRNNLQFVLFFNWNLQLTISSAIFFLFKCHKGKSFMLEWAPILLWVRNSFKCGFSILSICIVAFEGALHLQFTHAITQVSCIFKKLTLSKTKNRQSR